MAGIVVFGGTTEGRLFAEAFQGTDVPIHICVATEYGASLLPDSENLSIHAGRMNRVEMEQFLLDKNAAFCIDTTHPYAVEVTKNIQQACETTGVPYLRVLREEGDFSDKHGQICYKDSIEEAVDFLSGQSGTIFITTGSRDLEAYTKIPDYKTRCVARVLSTASVMEKCKTLGFEGRNLIGMQGPFGEELNYWMLKQVNASWMVTKNSGAAGGYQEKCEAALRAGVHLLVIGRTPEQNTKRMNLKEAIALVKDHYGIRRKRKVYLIGMGPGNPECMTMEAKKALRQSDVLIGARRMLDICPDTDGKPRYTEYHKEKILAFLEEHTQYQTAAILYSGDIGFYSGAKGMQEVLKDYEVEPISGLSSVTWFLNKLGVPWDHTILASCHGQETNLFSLVEQNEYVCSLLGGTQTVSEIAGGLIKASLTDIFITVGEQLSYKEERITSGHPEDFIDFVHDNLSVVLFQNPDPRKKKAQTGISDDDFIRGKVPMTKEEIRILSVAKLHLDEDSVVYDIGAGTGSVTVEMALQCKKGQVYAIEKNPDAVALIRQNKAKFQAENITVVSGTAPDCLTNLPAPTHIFIGGSSGEMIKIIQIGRRKNPNVRFVINTVTLETQGQLEEIRKTFPEYEAMEVIQVNISKAKKLGNYHLMMAQNPVCIASFGGESI